MTKKKAHSQLETAKLHTVSQNAMQQTKAWSNGLITDFMLNHKWGAPLKNTAKQTNNKKKGIATRAKVVASDATTITTPNNGNIDRIWNMKAPDSDVATSKSNQACTCSAAASEVASSPYSKPPPKPPTKAAYGRYSNYNAEPFKFTLAQSIEEK